MKEGIDLATLANFQFCFLFFITFALFFLFATGAAGPQETPVQPILIP
jgi:hypothetical protein